MLKITIPAKELWDEQKEEFTRTKEYTLQLEHSLVSVSKWEAKWKKPFLGKQGERQEKSVIETIDYIRCMTITQNVDPDVYARINNDVIARVIAYIDDPQTATWFSEDGKERKLPKHQTITAELIYYWMIALGIPVEFQKWHLNRLLTLIRVCNTMNKPSKKLSRKEIAKQNAAINAARRKKLGTAG